MSAAYPWYVVVFHTPDGTHIQKSYCMVEVTVSPAVQEDSYVDFASSAKGHSVRGLWLPVYLLPFILPVNMFVVVVLAEDPGGRSKLSLIHI